MRNDARDSDLTLVYMASRIGLDRGWSHIYSFDLQRQAFALLRPGTPFGSGERYLAPPPLAWLAAPLTVLGPSAAFYLWLAVSLLALAAAWWIAAPGTHPWRYLWLLAAVSWYPVQYSLSLGQPILIVMLAVLAFWRLAEGGRPYLAGAVLGLSVLKPQLALIVPAVLLVSGHWRIALAWALTAGALAGLSLLLIGSSGFSDYRSLMTEAQTLTNNRYFTMAYLLGAGTLSYAAAAAVVAIGLIGAYLGRGGSLARLIALGLVTTALAATYWHLQDFAILVGAAWLFWRDHPPVWQRSWLLFVAAAGELAWPLTPLPMLIALGVWFAILLTPSRVARQATASA